METLFQFELVKLYEVIRRCQLSSDTPTLYYHTDCRQGMAVHWPDSTSLSMGFGYGQGATAAYCPKCGSLMCTDHYGLNTFVYKHTTKVPTHAAFTVKERRHTLDFSIYMELVTIDPEFNDIYRPKYGRRVTQTIRFDFKEQRTYIVEKVGKQRTVSELNPFLDATLINLTGLLYVRGCSHLTDRKHQADLTAMMQTLKRAFMRKLSKKVGYKVDLGRALMQKTSADGLFTNLMLQLAWRLAVPDGPILNEGARKQLHTLGRPFEIDCIIDKTRQGLPFYKAVIEVKKLEDNRLVRFGIANSLGDTPVVYSYVKDIFTNYDYRKQAFTLLLQKRCSAHNLSNDTKAFLQQAVDAWGERYAVALIKCYDWNDLRDTASMVDQLGPADWYRFTQRRRPRARDLHDELVRYKVKVEHKDEPIQRGQVYRDLEFTSYHNFKFKAPKQVKGIHDLADAMHNCVAKLYLPKVKKGECAIVAVMKNKKPVACLEVGKDEGGRYSVLKQAKLRNNYMLDRDEQVQEAVLEWLSARNIVNKDYAVRG